MTQEQKAKAYDEALEWMRKVYPALAGADKEDAEHYFPELKEKRRQQIITEDYVSFETAKLLKEKGFDESCEGFYVNSGVLSHTLSNAKNSKWDEDKSTMGYISAPTLQMAMKWLREKEWVICIIPLTFYCGEKVSSWGYNIWAADNIEIDNSSTPEFNTYEEACEEAIKYCLENLI